MHQEVDDTPMWPCWECGDPRPAIDRDRQPCRSCRDPEWTLRKVYTGWRLWALGAGTDPAERYPDLWPVLAGLMCRLSGHTSVDATTWTLVLGRLRLDLGFDAAGAMDLPQWRVVSHLKGITGKGIATRDQVQIEDGGATQGEGIRVSTSGTSTVFKEVKEPRTTAQPPRLVLGPPRGRPKVDGRELRALTPARYRVIKALIEAGSDGLTMGKLGLATNMRYPHRILVALVKARPDEWGQVIELAGEDQKGYRIRAEYLGNSVETVMV